MTQVAQRPATSRLGPLQIAITVLAVFSSLVHLSRGLSMTLLRPHFAGGVRTGRFVGPHPGGPGGPGGFGGPPSGIMMTVMQSLPILFYLNFVGYIVLIVAYNLPALARYHRVIRWILICYAAITIIAWYLITHGSYNVLAYIDKPAELALIILLLIDDRQEASAHARAQQG